MDAWQAILSRHSVRSYQSKPVPVEIVEKVIQAGGLAATARNEQPWDFVVVADPERRKEIAKIAEYGKFIGEAPVCIVVLCKDTKYFLEDGSAATQNILLAATYFGLGSCWVAGDKKPYAPQIVSLVGAPQDRKLVSLIAMGYEARTAPRAQKKDPKDLCHWEKF